tara:strand:- start:1495 stop:1905 length:411 start_codon:yes stop_codon:yes gene_type:complete
MTADNSKSINYETLSSGDLISKRSYVIDEKIVNDYLSATQDQNSKQITENIPSMIIAALGLRGVVNDLKIPGGTLHVGQEINFKNSVSIGETLKCEAHLLSNTVRKDWRFMSVGIEVHNKNNSLVMEGKSSIMLPA